MDTIKSEESAQSAPREFSYEAELFKAQAPEHRYTLTPFLIPDKPDHQGDVIDRDEIRKIVWAVGLSKNLMDEEHYLVDKQVGEPVEKYVLPADTIFKCVEDYSPENKERLAKIAALQREIADTKEGRLVPEGSAMIGTIWKPEYWKMIKSGKKQGLSIYGRGRRTPIDQHGE